MKIGDPQMEDYPDLGAYDEVFSIQKSTTIAENQRLPTDRHSGYIVISFKILDDAVKVVIFFPVNLSIVPLQQNSLEKSWLSWTGAREVYKYSPTTWKLRRITLHRCMFR
jgi:hypothetical protein